MVGFAALPPEINSGRMYMGAGAAPLTAAATAWDRLAAELTGAANSFRAVIAQLTGESWAGAAAAAMTAAVQPYVGWMDTTAAQAAQTAHQARAAAAAYETAFAATVPPAAVAANRASLAHLAATNIFGLNAHAIAANQAQYAEMWSQDVAAMQGYQARSAAAAAVTPFAAAPQGSNDTNPGAAQSAQGGSFLERLGQFLSSLGTTGIWKVMNDFWTSTPMQYIGELSLLTTGFTASQGGLGFQEAGISLITAVPENSALAFTIWWVASQNAMSELGLLGAGSGGLGGLSSLASSQSALAGPAGLASAAGSAGSGGLGGVQTASAGLGRAAAVGGLSVPQSWGEATRDVRLAATALPMAGPTPLPQAGAMGAGSPGVLGGIPPVASALNASKTGDAGARYGNRPKVVAHLPGETGVRHDKADRPILDTASVLDERSELDQLRKEILDLARERDVLARSAEKLIKQAAEL